MTKPLPTGCIKDDKDISWQTFNFLLESVSEFDVKKQQKGNLFTMKFIHL